MGQSRHEIRAQVVAAGPTAVIARQTTRAELALPGGTVATTVHRGPCDRLDAAHRAVRAWCAAHGHELAGPRWEVYGDWFEDPAELEATVSYLIRPA